MNSARSANNELSAERRAKTAPTGLRPAGAMRMPVAVSNSFRVGLFAVVNPA
jgi:hypothetical protein